MPDRIKSFAELPSALKTVRRTGAEAAFAKSLDRACQGNADALADLVSAGLHKIPAARKDTVSALFYSAAKNAIQKLNFTEATVHLQHASELNPHCWIYGRRLELARNAMCPGSLYWRTSLLQLKADLRLLCPKHPCLCEDHFQIANCRHALEGEYDHEAHLGRGLDSVETYTVGHYFSWTKRTRWTKWLVDVKHNGKYELLPPMADITADFLATRTPILQRVDVLVPVPPDNEKFVKRDCLAPNDAVADRLSERLALPCLHAVLRRGTGTRMASESELRKQMSVDPALAARIRGASVVLLEDIWTWGRTIPICADVLREAGAKDVCAVALGESTR